MSRELLFALFFFTVLAFLLYQLYQVLAVFMTPLIWAALLALVFYPLQIRLTKLLRNRPTLASFLLTTLVIGLVIVPTVFLASLLVNESVAAYQRIEDLITSGRLSSWIDEMRAAAEDLVGGYVPVEGLSERIDLPATLLKVTNTISGYVVSNATGAVRNVLLALTNFFLMTFTLFFFFRDGERMVSSLRAAIPMEPGHKDAVLARFYDTLSAVVQGALLTALAQGLLAGIGYWIAGLPFIVLLGSATAFLSLFPAGAALIWVPAVIYLVATGAWGKGIVLLLWGALVVGSVDNIIRPLIIGGRTQIPTIFLFFGILGGLQVYGFLGMFLGPVLIATLVAFIQIFREEYQTE